MTNTEHTDRPGPVGSTATEVVTPPTSTTSGASSGGSGSGIREQARGTMGTAAEEGKHVTAVAGEEAQKVAAEARQQGRILLEDARSQLDEQSRMQRDRLVQTLSSLGQDLDRMSNQADEGLAADLVRNAAQRARSFSSRLEGREPTELLDEVRDFARRKPGTFLLGALAAGMVAGRLARGARSASSAEPMTTTRRTGVVPSMREPSSSMSTGMGTTAAGTTGTTTGTTGTARTTPTSSSVADYPAEQPGEIR